MSLGLALSAAASVRTGFVRARRFRSTFVCLFKINRHREPKRGQALAATKPGSRAPPSAGSAQ